MEWVRSRSLTLVMMGCFAVFLAGQVWTGWYEYNATLVEHGVAAVTLRAYFSTGHLWEALFENWESEFLQMAAFVTFTVVLVQQGSPESRRLGVREFVDADPRDFAHLPDVPWPVRRGGCALFLYERSLGLVLILLFVISWAGHALGDGRSTSTINSCTASLAPACWPTCHRADSGSNRFRTGKASSCPSRPWSGWRSTCVSAAHPNRNRCTRRIRTRGDEPMKPTFSAEASGCS